MLINHFLSTQLCISFPAEICLTNYFFVFHFDYYTRIKLKMALSEKYFRELADQLVTEWEGVATQLDFLSSDVSRFKLDHRGVSNQVFAMLVAWWQKQGCSELAARQQLLHALRKVDRNDLAEKLAARTAVAIRQGVTVDIDEDMEDGACGGVQITANIINPQSTASTHQSQPHRPLHCQPQRDHATTNTYQAPPVMVPYIGRLTVTGKNSPVIIGSVANSTFNFGCGSNSSDN